MGAGSPRYSADACRVHTTSSRSFSSSSAGEACGADAESRETSVVGSDRRYFACRRPPFWYVGCTCAPAQTTTSAQQPQRLMGRSSHRVRLPRPAAKISHLAVARQPTLRMENGRIVQKPWYGDNIRRPVLAAVPTHEKGDLHARFSMSRSTAAISGERLLGWQYSFFLRFEHPVLDTPHGG